MEGKDFDIRIMFNEPEFKVEPQKYINKLRSLLREANEYIKALELEAENKDGMEKIIYRCQIVLSEFQRENIQQMINSLEFYTK